MLLPKGSWQRMYLAQPSYETKFEVGFGGLVWYTKAFGRADGALTIERLLASLTDGGQWHTR